MTIESNAHMFSRDRQRYPFHPRAAYIPDPGSGQMILTRSAAMD